MQDNIKHQLIEILNTNEYSCVAMDKNGVQYKNVGLGVKPIIEPMRRDRDFFKNMFVGDKIIGKAGALLLSLSGAKYVYSLVMSVGAVNVFKKYSVEYEYEELVEYIENRTHNGMCPLEDAVKDCENKFECVEIIEKRIDELMNNKL